MTKRQRTIFDLEPGEGGNMCDTRSCDGVAGWPGELCDRCQRLADDDGPVTVEWETPSDAELLAAWEGGAR